MISRLLIIAVLFFLTTVVYGAQKHSLVPPPGKSVSFYLAKGGRFLETGNYQQAIIYLDAALHAPRRGVKPAIIQLAEKLYKSAQIYEEARILRESGQAESAVEKYLKIMEINPVDPKPIEFIVEVYDLLSEAAEKRDNYEEAARLYENWLKYAPQNDFPRKGLLKNLRAAAESAAARGDNAGSIAFYRKIASIDPNDPSVPLLEAKAREMEKERAIGAAEAKLKFGDLDSVITDLNTLLNMYPNEPRLVEMLRLARGRRTRQEADSLMSSHRYHEALSLYQKTATLLPEESEEVGKRLAEIKLRTGANYRSDGTLRGRGFLAGPAKIAIAGKTVTILEGKENITINLTGNELPARPFATKLERIEGDMMIRIAGGPEHSNNYSLILDLAPKSGKSFSFELNWELETKGSVNWRGRVEGRALLWLQGPFVDQTGSVQQASSNYDPLPHENYRLKLEKLQGSDGVRARIIENPTPANDYGAMVEVTTSGPEEVELRMDWTTERKIKRR